MAFVTIDEEGQVPVEYLHAAGPAAPWWQGPPQAARAVGSASVNHSRRPGQLRKVDRGVDAQGQCRSLAHAQQPVLPTQMVP